MGSKDEEIILIHATMHYNEHSSSVNTSFFFSSHSLFFCSTYSCVSHPHISLYHPSRCLRWISPNLHSENWGEDKRQQSRTGAQEPSQMAQMIPLFLSIAAIIVIIPNSCLLCRDADMFNRWCRLRHTRRAGCLDSRWWKTQNKETAMMVLRAQSNVGSLSKLWFEA